MFVQILSPLIAVALASTTLVSDLDTKVQGRALTVTVLKYKMEKVQAAKYVKCDLKKSYWQPDFSLGSSINDGAWVRNGEVKDRYDCKKRELLGHRFEPFNFREEIVYKDQLQVAELASSDQLEGALLEKARAVIARTRKNLRLAKSISRIEVVIQDLSTLEGPPPSPDIQKADEATLQIVERFTRDDVPKATDQITRQ